MYLQQTGSFREREEVLEKHIQETHALLCFE